MLKAGELKEFKWSVEEYIKKGRENAIDKRWMKERENAGIKVQPFGQRTLVSPTEAGVFVVCSMPGYKLRACPISWKGT